MNIVYLVSNIRKSGPLKVVESIMYNLPQNDNIYIISIFGSSDSNIITSEYKNRNIKVLSLHLNKYNFVFKFKNKIDKLFNEIKPDIIHSHGIIADYVNSKLKYKNRVSTIHCNFYEDYSKRFGILGYIIANVHFVFCNKLELNICCSESIYNAITKKIKNSTYIRNGIDIIKYSNEEKKTIKQKIRNELNIDNNAIVYIYCGKLSKRKRVNKLIKMFKKVCTKDEVLLIVGIGPELNKCIKIQNENVRILGYKNNPNDYYLASDIYASNSTSEGMSISVLEALNCGCKLLLSNIPSHREIIKIDNDLYLGEIFNRDNLRNCMDIIENNLKTDISKITDKISAKTMANKYMTIYKQFSIKIK